MGRDSERWGELRSGGEGQGEVGRDRKRWERKGRGVEGQGVEVRRGME